MDQSIPVPQTLNIEATYKTGKIQLLGKDNRTHKGPTLCREYSVLSRIIQLSHTPGDRYFHELQITDYKTAPEGPPFPESRSRSVVDLQLVQGSVVVATTRYSLFRAQIVHSSIYTVTQ